ncbi:MAG: histone deacetylase family protein [Chloroflexia bacterium]
MYVVYSSRQERHDPPFQFHFGQRAEPTEVPERARALVRAIAEAGLGEIVEPRDYPLELLTRVHSPEYLEFLRTANTVPMTDAESRGKPAEVLFPSVWPFPQLWPVRTDSIMAKAGAFCFDTYTPILPTTYEAAVAAALCALTGADLLLEGRGDVLALCRPPGHHAMRAMCGGYCYLNNAAIAADRLAQYGPVAILDVDYHHGNGTQSIFYETDRVLYVSIHADPRNNYPFFSGYADERGAGEGAGFTLNFPLPSGATDQAYAAALEQALNAVNQYMPRFLVLSLGFDTCQGDPIGDFALTPEFYGIMAARIASLRVPTLLVTEGGYHLGRIGELAVRFLRGWQEATRSR